MNNKRSSEWLAEREKYALVGLDVKIEGEIPEGEIGRDLWVLAGLAFNIPEHWTEWLGSIRVEEVEDCNLFLISKLLSSTPDVLDNENNLLKRRVWHFYIGLLLAKFFSTAHKPVLLSGSRHGGEIDVREHGDLEAPICSVAPYPPIFGSDIRHAAQMATQIEALTAASSDEGRWRFIRVINIYVEARTTRDILDRIHQYCRCIDGLILPDTGKTRSQFKSRTELFIGPHYHELMGEMYDVRSAVEHLNENRYLETFDREIRLDLIKKEAIAEFIARTAIARILVEPNLWTHFANATGLAAFWKLSSEERRRVWGSPSNPLDAIADFDPKYIHNGQLGAG